MLPALLGVLALSLVGALVGSPLALAQSPPTDLRSSEAAWWSMLGETVPGRPPRVVPRAPLHAGAGR